MQPVSAGQAPTAPAPAAGAPSVKNRIFKIFKAEQDTVALNSGKFIRGSIGQGIARMVKMALLRPRGWVELASIPFTMGAFQLKHFLEGLIGADSLIKKRVIRLSNLSGAHTYGGRTLFEALKDGLRQFTDKI